MAPSGMKARTPFDSDVHVVCISRNGNDNEASSFILEFCGSRFLLECDLELHHLRYFRPTHLPLSSAVENPYVKRNHDFKNYGDSSIHAGKCEIEGAECGNNAEEFNGIFCEINGNAFINDAPKYLFYIDEVIDSYDIDAVLISNPISMLGLPFLKRKLKVFATEATVQVARLIMKELISLDSLFSHRQALSSVEYFSKAGHSYRWLNPANLSALPNQLREALAGVDGVLLAKWRSLYNLEEMEASLSQVNTLRMKEAVNLGTGVSITPVSSGASFGCCNWLLTGLNSQFRMCYFSSSLLFLTHSTPLDVKHFSGCDLILFNKPASISNQYPSEFSYSEKSDSAANNGLSKRLKRNEGFRVAFTQENTASGTQAKFEVNLKPSVNDSSVRSRLPKDNGKRPNQFNRDIEQSSAKAEDAYMREKPDNADWGSRLRAISTRVIEALRCGGRVLIPVLPGGILLELIEEIAKQLDEVGLPEIPLIYSSPIAEDFFALCNTIPEWVHPARVEKMYDGANPLFEYVNLIKNKRLKFVPHFMSSVYAKEIQSPCVVFCCHLFLRHGSSVDLLIYFQTHPQNALILIHPNLDVSYALSPFISEDMKMKIFYIPIYSTFGANEMLNISSQLKPRHVLVSSCMEDVINENNLPIASPSSPSKTTGAINAISTSPPSTPSASVSALFTLYRSQILEKVSFVQNEIKVLMTEEELKSLQPSLVNYCHAKALYVNANLSIQTEPWNLRSLRIGSGSPASSSEKAEQLEISPHLLVKSPVNAKALLLRLRDMGLSDVVMLEADELAGGVSVSENEWLRFAEGSGFDAAVAIIELQQLHPAMDDYEIEEHKQAIFNALSSYSVLSMASITHNLSPAHMRLRLLMEYAGLPVDESFSAARNMNVFTFDTPSVTENTNLAFDIPQDKLQWQTLPSSSTESMDD